MDPREAIDEHSAAAVAGPRRFCLFSERESPRRMPVPGVLKPCSNGMVSTPRILPMRPSEQVFLQISKSPACQRGQWFLITIAFDTGWQHQQPVETCALRGHGPRKAAAGPIWVVVLFASGVAWGLFPSQVSNPPCWKAGARREGALIC